LIEVGEMLVREQERVRTMSLVNEYNQALTPADQPLYGFQSYSPHQFRESELMTPPASNPLQPYALGKARKSQPGPPASSPWQRLRESRLNQLAGAAKPAGTNQVETNTATLPQPTRRQISSIVATGQKLGIEHVGQRRFRNNTWQSYTTLNQPSEAEATRQLQSCLRQFSDHYVRLIGIDPHSKQRITETIVHRPSP
ncbi:MAG: ribulose bisphosphate carboxylase small subunit, partial [Phormidesmis sp.]